MLYTFQDKVIQLPLPEPTDEQLREYYEKKKALEKTSSAFVITIEADYSDLDCFIIG